MKVVYKTDDGMEFDDREKAERYEVLSKNKVTVEETIKRTRTLISPDELKNIFELGEVSDMYFYLKEADGTIVRDGCYEIYFLDDTGHLYCTDLDHGLLEWSEEDHSYYRKVHYNFWKVELLGIERVSYY
jgi:outer membrane protein assembly factor BamB